ncbi:hypothetical protein FRC01_005247 [Tulasnella sp. 417]|nr:hypothetical protein FRC01_005247 [Tulasnella sp. 417]
MAVFRRNTSSTPTKEGSSTPKTSIEKDQMIRRWEDLSAFGQAGSSLGLPDDLPTVITPYYSKRYQSGISTTEAMVKKNTSKHAVDEEYEKLARFHVNCRRIVLVDDTDPPEGGFGVVRCAELYQSAYLPAWLASRRYGPPQLVAVKQIKITKMSSTPRVKRAFTREILVWSSFEAHPGIAKFLGFYADFGNSKAWLISPWEPNGNVSEFVKAHNLEVPEKLSLIYDTIDALTFLHQLDPPVCHGDIKAANVLVGTDYKARLCDFGLARLHEDSGFGRLETSTGDKGSIRWCSPELIDGAPRAPSSDVYAWAWLVWEIMTGDLPYEGTSTDYAIIRKIFESPLPEVNGASRLSDCLQVWELMRRCWNVDPVQRPTARMCKTTVTYLPRCTPTPSNADHQKRSPALLENLGNLETWKGNIKKGSEYLDEALRLYHEESNAKGIASVLRKQVVAAFRITDFVAVRATATTALGHCRALDDAVGIAETLYYLGYSIMMLPEPGNMDEAFPILRESLEIRRSLGDDIGVGQCLERMGDLQRCQGQQLDALSTMEEAMAIAIRSGDLVGLASALQMVGLANLALQDYVKAGDALSRAIVITRNVGWDGDLPCYLGAMGRLKIQLGEFREAEGLFEESISISRRIGLRWELAIALGGLAECLQENSKLSEATPLLGEAFRLWNELSQPSEAKSIALTLVELKKRQGKLGDVLVWYDHIMTVCRSQNEHFQVVEYLIAKGNFLVGLQRHAQAALHFEAAMVTCRENGYSWFAGWEQLCAVPKTVMTWERRLPLLCDVKRLQRRLPQLVTAGLKLPIFIAYGED